MTFKKVSSFSVSDGVIIRNALYISIKFYYACLYSHCSAFLFYYVLFYYLLSLIGHETLSWFNRENDSLKKKQWVVSIANWSSPKVSKTHYGEKRTSSTNTAGKTGYPHVEDWN
jgi:hypothetical protein